MIQEAIRKIIKERKLKQKDICEKIGANTAHFSTFMHGKRNLPISQLEALFEFLGLEIGEKE